MQLRKIRVYGRLRQFLGKAYFEAAVQSPKQAIRFLLANFPKLEKHMNDQLYKIKVGNLEVSDDLLDIQSDEEIRIIPIAIGSKGAILGGLLVAGGAALGGAAIGATVVGGAIATGLTTVGVTLLVNEAVNLLIPQPKVPRGNVEDIFSQNDPAFQSFGFSGITNVSKAGVPIPIIYGEVFTGSVVISSGIDTVNVE